MITSQRAGAPTRKIGAFSFAFILVLQVMLLVICIAPAATATTIPSNIGDWTVSAEETYDGGSATVTGNILVQAGGKLVLNNLNISMSGTAPDSLTIKVAQGGSLMLVHSTIKASDYLKPYLFLFEDGSTGLITNSTIKNVGSPYSMGGLKIIGTANVDIRSTLISDSFNGIIADGSDPTVEGCTINGGQGHGVFALNNARPIVANTTIAGFTQGNGIYLDQSDAEVRSSTVQSNRYGIGLYSAHAMIDDVTVRSNSQYGLYLDSSDPSLVNTRVSDNLGDGIYAKGSSLVLDSVTVLNNGGNGLAMTEGSALVKDSKLDGSGLNDISMTGPVQGQPTKVSLQNTTYLSLDFSDPNSKSILEVSWYFSLKAVYQSDGRPVPAATIWLSDSTGAVVLKSATGFDGTLGTTSIMSYFITTNGKVTKTPHVLTVEKGLEKQDVDLDLSFQGKDVSLVFDDISPWINLDPVTSLTNEPTVTVGGLVAPDTAKVTLNGASATMDLIGHRFSGIVELVPGQNEILIEAVDKVGNANNTTVNVLNDIVPPLLQITSPEVRNGAPIFTNVGYMSIKGQTEASAILWVGDTFVGQTTNGLFDQLVSLSPGNNVITIKAVDLAGNSAVASLVVYYDPDAPVLQLTEPKFTSTNQRNLVVSGNVNDPDAKVVVNLNGAETKVALDGMSFKLTVTLVEGTNQLVVKAIDQAGNSVQTSRSLVLDTISPQLVIDNPVDGLLTSARTILVTGMTDENSILTVNGAGAQRDGLYFTAVVSLAEGKNYIEVVSSDEAGNARTARATVTRDATAPVITVISPSDGLITRAEDISVDGYVSEETGLLLNGHVLSVDPDGSVFKTVFALSEGRNVLELEARDRAGNLGHATVIITRDSLVSLDSIRVEEAGKGLFLVRGRTDPDATLTINGEPYAIEESGFFKVQISAKGGEELIIDAKDPIGNIKSMKMTTPKGAPGPISYNWGPAMMVVSFTMVVIVVGLVGGTERGKLFALFFLFVPLYSRMKKNTVLDHYVRGQIHGYIVANPGDHYNSIKDALKLNNGTLAYHIRVLEKEGIVKSRSDGIYKRFYPSDMKVPENDGTRLTEIQKIILKRIKETPGISQKEMSRLVGVSPSTINYHIDILKSAGLVRSERRGMRIGYFLEDIVALKKAEDHDRLSRKRPALDEDKKFQKDLEHHDFSVHDDGPLHAEVGPAKKFFKKPLRPVAPVYDPNWEHLKDREEKGDEEH